MSSLPIRILSYGRKWHSVVARSAIYIPHSVHLYICVPLSCVLAVSLSGQILRWLLSQPSHVSLGPIIHLSFVSAELNCVQHLLLAFVAKWCFCLILVSYATVCDPCRYLNYSSTTYDILKYFTKFVSLCVQSIHTFTLLKNGLYFISQKFYYLKLWLYASFYLCSVSDVKWLALTILITVPHLYSKSNGSKCVGHFTHVSIYSTLHILHSFLLQCISTHIFFL